MVEKLLLKAGPWFESQSVAMRNSEIYQKYKSPLISYNVSKHFDRPSCNPTNFRATKNCRKKEPKALGDKKMKKVAQRSVKVDTNLAK